MAASAGHQGNDDEKSFDANSHPSPIDNVAVDEDEGEKKELAGLNDLDGIKRSWNLGGLVVIWISGLLLSFATSLNNQMSNTLSSYATSSFASAPVLGTVMVVQAVVSAGWF